MIGSFMAATLVFGIGLVSLEALDASEMNLRPGVAEFLS
jgi:hypothetical protein